MVTDVWDTAIFYSAIRDANKSVIFYVCRPDPHRGAWGFHVSVLLVVRAAD